MHGPVEHEFLVLGLALEDLEEEDADLLAVADDEFVGGEVEVHAALLGEDEQVGADGVGVVLLVELGVGVGEQVEDPER